MNQKYTTILEVYQNLMKNAQYYREQATKETGARKEKMEDIAHELYQVAANLENTREVNPPEDDFCSICHEPIYGRVQVHHHNEKCPKCGYEMIATQKHTC